MNKKKWALVILAAILIFGYFKFFHKTYSPSVVPASADCIVAVDVKRITNTLIWQYITTPSQWKVGRLFPKKDDRVSWKDIFELPDFLFAFHSKGQPANAWYLLLSIKDQQDLEKGLVQFRFEKLSAKEWINKELGVRFFVSGEQVLVSSAAVAEAYLAAVVTELFNKKSYTTKERLKTAVNANSHLAVYIAPNQFLQKEAVISANFDKQQVRIKGSFSASPQYAFSQAAFNFDPGHLAVAGSTQPPASVYALLDSTQKQKISKALNFELDSVMLQSNRTYALNLEGVRQRVDSAISYTYDDEFNKIEQVVVNKVQEPAFNFSISGTNVAGIQSYLRRSGKLEITAAGELFTPMPLVKSYSELKGPGELAITSFNYKATSSKAAIDAIFFFNLAVSKIPASIQKYLPESLLRASSNIERISSSLTKDEQELRLSILIEKKKNDLPIVKL